jgi:tripartite-type tricarboxylate transporter receptor subunit TctC
VIQKRSFLRAGVALVAATWMGAAFPQAGSQTTIVLPYPPGGASDTLARLIAERLQARLGQPVVVEYKPGGNHAIANQYVNSQSANGQTLYLIATPFSAAPAANPAVHKYHPARDFTPIARLTTNTAVLVANAKFPANSVPELVAYAKANPGKVQFATTGIGSLDHLLAWRMGKLTGTTLNLVHYKGAGQAFQDLMGGHVDLKIDSYASAKPALDSGRAKLIAVADPVPSSLLPDYKTINDAIPGAFLSSYFGVVGPRGMPADVSARLSTVLGDVIRSEELAPKLKLLAMEAAPMGPSEFAKYMSDGYGDVQAIVKDAGIKME